MRRVGWESRGVLNYQWRLLNFCYENIKKAGGGGGGAATDVWIAV